MLHPHSQTSNARSLSSQATDRHAHAIHEALAVTGKASAAMEHFGVMQQERLTRLDMRLEQHTLVGQNAIQRIHRSEVALSWLVLGAGSRLVDLKPRIASVQQTTVFPKHWLITAAERKHRFRKRVFCFVIERCDHVLDCCKQRVAALRSA